MFTKTVIIVVFVAALAYMAIAAMNPQDLCPFTALVAIALTALVIFKK